MLIKRQGVVLSGPSGGGDTTNKTPTEIVLCQNGGTMVAKAVCIPYFCFIHCLPCS